MDPVHEKREISGQTCLAVVIGSPVRHSLSPAIHNAAFAATGFDAVYLAMPVEPGHAAGAVEAMRRFEWLGMSVTMPHKGAIASACDRATAPVDALGVANCVFWEAGELVADNTDGEGFVRGLGHELGVEPAGMRCAMVGAGGAARAIIAALGAHGAAQVVVINRNPERAAEAAGLAGTVGRVGTRDDLAEADLVVNATPLGMAGAGHERSLPFDVARLRDDAVVADLIYHPAQTPLLAAAVERGLRHQNGLAMLVFQAAVQFEHWTGRPAPIAAMTAAVS